MSGRRQRAAGASGALTPNYNDLPPLTFIIRALFWRLSDVALTPFRLAYALSVRFLGTTGPPAFHVMLLLSLVPLISIWSLSAGLVVRSWIPTGWKQVVYLQYGTGQAPFADITLPTLSAGQAYDIALELVMPLHAKNTDLGNFMTSITITTPTNITLAHSSRPSLIFPHPVSSFFPFSPLIYSGAVRTHSVLVPLIEEFSASAYLSSLRARVQVGRADGWSSVGTGYGKELVVVQAFARGIPRMRGIRGFFMNHSLLLLALTSLSFFIATSIAAIAAYLFFSPAIKFSPTPLAVPPSYSEVGRNAEYGDDNDVKAIKAEEASGSALGLLEMKQEDDDEETFVSSPIGTSDVGSEDHEGTESGSVISGDEQATEDGEETVTEGGSEDEGSGSEGEVIDLGASALRH